MTIYFYTRNHEELYRQRDDRYGIYAPGFNITAEGHCADCGRGPDTGRYHSTFECPNCGNEVCENNYAHCAHCNACVCCDECRYPNMDSDDEDEYDSRDRRIFYYSYKPDPIWYGGPGAPYYLGAELEISADGDASAAPVYEWAASAGYRDLFYCKEDGSVDGFEIVTHPMTPEFVSTFPWDDFFDMLNSEYPHRGQEAREHGLHIHVSRSAFKGSTSALARFAYLLNVNVEQVTAIARRGSNHYTTFADRPVSEVALSRYDLRTRAHNLAYDGAEERRKAAWSAYGSKSLMGRSASGNAPGVYFERYRVVNLLNTETVEVRAFRSTRKAGEFMDAMRLMIDAVSFVTDMQLRHMPTAARVAWPTFEAFRKGETTYQTVLAV